MSGPAGSSRGGPPGGGEREIPLPGGLANRGRVVRIGDTVRRPLRPTSPATHALLRHLEKVDFPGAPRFLGVDAQDREVLSYLPGTTPIRPYPDWALTDEALRSVAHLLRAYHRAVADFDPTPYVWPASPPEALAGELVSHNDPNLDNVVFRDGRAVALIDFDLASPGSRLWDVACAARLWAPLRPDTRVRDARSGQGFRRLRLFLEAYGAADLDRAQVALAVQQNQEWFWHLVDRYAAAGHAAFLEYSRSEVRMPPADYRGWLAANASAVRDALGSADR
jgi:Ser/Thr protein kinase RdoA (MazF antagonist)